MRTFSLYTATLAASISLVVAQQNLTYLTGLASTLTSAGLTELVNVTTSINSTETGQGVLAELPNGNFTVFAPNNNAFSNNVSASTADNASLLANIISYHILPGNFTSEIATYPNVTIGRTLLNDSSLVTLEGNKSQVIVLSTIDNSVQVLNQIANVTLQSNTTYVNLDINTINGVLTPPGNFTDICNANNLTSVLATINMVPGLSDLITSARGLTLFAPSNEALSAAAPELSGITSNTTLLLTVLQNHAINGTSVYSPNLLSGSNFTSAAGETIAAFTNSSGSYVTSGSSGAAAKIIKSDVLVSNGVIHVLDGVLANIQSDSAAASSAFESATSVAAKSTTETGPVGPTGTSPSGSTHSSSASRRLSFDGTILGVIAGALFALT